MTPGRECTMSAAASSSLPPSPANHFIISDSNAIDDVNNAQAGSSIEMVPGGKYKDNAASNNDNDILDDNDSNDDNDSDDDDNDDDSFEEDDDSFEDEQQQIRTKRTQRYRFPMTAVRGNGSQRQRRMRHLDHIEGSGDDYHISNTLLPKALYQYMHAPNDPRAVQLFRLENVAIPACYLLVGLLQGLSGPFTNVYPLDLGATEAQQATISSIKSLPASFKLIFGFISDNIPLCGYRRKSYMLLGWGITSLSMFTLVSFADLSIDAVVQYNKDSTFATHTTTSVVEGGGGEGGVVMVEDGISSSVGEPPSIVFLSICLLLFGTGYWFADVMGDSIVAEKAKLESSAHRGQLQSTCYACRFFGLMIAAPCGTVIYSSLGPRALVGLMAILPACIVPLVFALGESKNVHVKSTKEQCYEIWETVCSRAVWQPMGFVYLYNVLQVGNAAWKQFLKTVLHFTSNQLNTLLVVAYVLLWVGIMVYKKYFINWSWRSIYIATTALNGVFSSLQILLIKGKTFGLSPFLFALGDDAFADFIAGIQFLPTTIMMVHLCPVGSEGASYAMFTTVSNSAGNLAGAFSTLLLSVWDVSKESMEMGQLQGMINLTWLTTAIQMSGLLFVGLLPRTKEDLANLHADPMSGSKVGGFLFLLVTFSSILYSLVVGILNIVKPGWAGES